MSMEAALNENEECLKMKEFLKRVDERFYHRAVENSKRIGKYFPHRGEDAKMFENTFYYVNLFKNTK